MAKRRLKLAPTTLSLWKACPRKGAFRTIAKAKIPLGPGLYEGRVGHSHVEAYCSEGTIPPRDDRAERAKWMHHVDGPDEYKAATNVWSASKAAQSAYKAWVNAYMGRVVGDILGSLPEPGPGVEIEQRVEIETGHEWLYHGRFDVIVDQKRVIDPKFYAASSMKKYAHTEETLRDDPQAVIYSAWCDDPDPEFTMLYIVKPPRKGGGTAKAKPVTVKYTSEEIDRRLDTLDELSEKIAWYVDNVSDPNDVPHNADLACEGVGIGCDYAPLCRLDKQA